jgi:hypothetical protein
MPSKPRKQWIPNHKLRAARERVYGRKSRTPFANAVKRRCEARFGGHCGVDHRKVRRWEEGQCVPDVCHQEVICELIEVPWEERDQLGFPVPDSSEPSLSEPVSEVTAKTALRGGLVLNKPVEPVREVLNGVTVVNGQCSVCGCQMVRQLLLGTADRPRRGKRNDVN